MDDTKYLEYSQKISERLWNLPDKGELESRREETFIDDIVQKSHIEKELLASLSGIKTVSTEEPDAGAFRFFLQRRG